jgi:predicted nucleic acid-binding protein
LSRGLLDTSVFIAQEAGRPVRGDSLPDDLAVSVITIAELRAGVLAARDLEARDRRLATLTKAQALYPIPVDEAIAEAWARLRVALRDAGRRMPINDSWIAATAMLLRIPVVSQDDDYSDIPGLDVIRV